MNRALQAFFRATVAVYAALLVTVFVFFSEASQVAEEKKLDLWRDFDLPDGWIYVQDQNMVVTEKGDTIKMVKNHGIGPKYTFKK
jgi:hypothetical protein